MRKGIALLAGVSALLCAAMRLSCSSAMAAPVNSSAAAIQEPAGGSDVNARIARIENGLLPPVLIKGQPVQPMTIADRMALQGSGREHCVLRPRTNPLDSHIRFRRRRQQKPCHR